MVPELNPTTEAMRLLAAENNGGEILIRDPDGTVFIRSSVAERVIERLLAQAQNRMVQDLERNTHA